MATMKLSSAERDLFDAVEHGEPIRFAKRQRIDAEILRHIVLRLPLVKKGIGPRAKEVACRTTGAGISIKGGHIVGPLQLGAAVGECGGPVVPLCFDDCVFDGGLAAAFAYFSRLALTHCAVIAPVAGKEAPIDLTGATVDRDLDLRGLRPAGDDASVLWVAAAGLRVRGGLNLSQCRLKVPANREADGPALDALDLTLAKIDGGIPEILPLPRGICVLRWN